MDSTDSRPLDAVAWHLLRLLLHQKETNRSEKSPDARNAGTSALGFNEWDCGGDLHRNQLHRGDLTRNKA